MIIVLRIETGTVEPIKVYTVLKADGEPALGNAAFFGANF